MQGVLDLVDFLVLAEEEVGSGYEEVLYDEMRGRGEWCDGVAVLLWVPLKIALPVEEGMVMKVGLCTCPAMMSGKLDLDFGFVGRGRAEE